MIYDKLNDGIYKVGFEKSVEAYEETVAAVFDIFDILEGRLTAYMERVLNLLGMINTVSIDAYCARILFYPRSEFIRNFSCWPCSYR